ncbi:hypothetical protein ACHAW5_004624 [Stephanodiscus triporus]|uniref:Peptidase A1 domain-containing protein n=1 Tax=Stephanodiscus triporus TaxID=2934178 RepID=A0ABD3QUC0_9STRA
MKTPQQQHPPFGIQACISRCDPLCSIRHSGDYCTSSSVVHSITPPRPPPSTTTTTTTQPPVRPVDASFRSSSRRTLAAAAGHRPDAPVVGRRASLVACAAGLFASRSFDAPRDAIALDDLLLDERDFDDRPRTTTAAATADVIVPSLPIPLRYRPDLSAYTARYVIGNSHFGAIVDTGSPFLLVPYPSVYGTCRPDYEWGCLRPEDGRDAGLRPTSERFDGNEGRVEWREGRFSFVLDDYDENDDENNDVNDENVEKTGQDAHRSASSMRAMQSVLFPRSTTTTFGVASESLLDGPGGIFLGLVKYADPRIRPSFLGQSDVTAFSIDLRDDGGDDDDDGRMTTEKTLTLYGSAAGSDGGAAMPPPRNAIPLVRDLNRKYGDPTIHYVGVASTINVNGLYLAPSSSATTTTTSSSSSSGRNARKNIYCIFDTGCSGMSVSPSLFDARYATARANREKSLWGTVNVEFVSASGEIVTLSAKRPITTTLGNDERPWGKSLEGHAIVVLGLTFLDGVRMTVDIEGDRIWFED